MWIDSHCHLNADDFLNEQGQDERDLVLKRAQEALITQMIVIGSGKGWAEIEASLLMAERELNLYAAIAVHPHDVSILDDRQDLVTDKHIINNVRNIVGEHSLFSGEVLWKKIEKLAFEHPKVVAIGETGLDYFYQHAPKEKQKTVFERFLQLAKDSQKPVSLHIRDAHQDAQEMMKNFPQCQGVIHCFTGTLQEAKVWMDLGFYISFSGIVTFPKATLLQEVCQQVPLEQMMLETDCPYLAPVPMRGKRNEPAYLTHTAYFISQLRRISLAELAIQTTKNAQTLFKLPVLSS